VVLIPRKVYFDHNATTPVAPEVRRAMDRVLKRCQGNPSSLHTQGRVARGIVDKARSEIATVLGCEPGQVTFTSGGTEANNAVIKGVFCRRSQGHIITSRIEHESVIGSCRQVESMGGSVTWLSAGWNGLVDPAAVRAAIRPDTILVSIMHANNETGAIQPVTEIGRIAREAGIPFHTDAVQSFCKIPTNVDEIDCEFLTVAAHKIKGPKGVGALYWRGGTAWEPLVFGGDQERSLRAGTEGVHQVAGFGAAAQLVAGKREETGAYLAWLRDGFLAGLARIAPDARVNAAPHGAQLPGTLNVTFPGVEGIHLLAGLDCYEVCVSIGSACTADRIEPSHVLLGMGMGVEDALSTIRISMGSSNTLRDVRYVLAVLRKVLEGPPPGFAYLDAQHLDEQRIRSDRVFLIDLRWPYERMLSPTIHGAVEWSPIHFDRFLKRIPRDKEVILMCGTGIFSFAAAYRLARHGHRNVRVVYGGYAAWENLHPGLAGRLRERS
jgi:cysteine desulfurase